MSHALQSIGHGISRAFKAVGSAVSRFAHSTVGRVIIAAAAIYLTAGLASGAFAAAPEVAAGVTTATEAGAGFTAASEAFAGGAAAAEGGLAEGGLDAAITAGEAGSASEGASLYGASGAADAGNASLMADLGSQGTAEQVAGEAGSAGDAAATNTAASTPETATANLEAPATDQQGLINQAMTPDASATNTAMTPDVSAQTPSAMTDPGAPAPGSPAAAPATPSPVTPATNAQLDAAINSAQASAQPTSGGIIDSAMNAPGKMAEWYKGLSAPGQMAVGQAIAGGGTAMVNAISAQQARATAQEQWQQRQDYHRTPDMTALYRKYNGGIIGNRLGRVG